MMLASLLYVSPVLAPFVAVIVACKVWERWMEKRTARANELPAQSPVASEAATVGNVQLVLIRGNKRWDAITATKTARTRRIGTTRALPRSASLRA